MPKRLRDKPYAGAKPIGKVRPWRAHSCLGGSKVDGELRTDHGDATRLLKRKIRKGLK